MVITMSGDPPQSGFVVWFSGDYMSAPPPSPRRDNLARIHDAIGVERPFERPHGAKRRLAMLRREIFHLPLPDPVLARGGALHGKRARHQAFAQGLGARDLVMLVQIDQQREVE